ncbi:ArnT family glycosyltransferase [Arundinibacter roseus]|uniref:Glycosyltransferase family 39 protein n=1 Tax=Arundinibacter roseus TaxID=2070510 RepID=A0A4V2XAT8_9BACT|nr:glycosyltransferase family 39 protein [Arundinibacter roseus]TDB68955.1 glycosyltransferase family 39 protein [Arundinibacter roseus]
MLLTDKNQQIVLWILMLFGFGWGLSNAPLFDEDEGFFAEGTREMVLRQDFISTYINQEARYDKPPLTNWLQYAATQLLGWTEAAMRLPSALAAIAWMWTIYFFTKRKLNHQTAWYAALFATCALQVTIIGKAALADALLNAALAGAMFCLFELLAAPHRQLNYILLFYFLTGLGFLTKGPIAVLVPGAVTILYLLRWRTWKPLLRLLHPGGIALFLLVATPWYVLQYQKNGDEFLQGFFMNHNLNRFQTAFEGHYGGILYFVPILLVGLLPFTGLMLRALGKARFLWYDRYFSFLLLWFAFVFVFFSLSGTKLHHYIIYGYSPLFVLGGWYASQSRRPVGVGPLMSLLIVLTVIPFILPAGIPYVNDEYAVEVMRGAAEQFDVWYVLTMVFLLLLLGLTGFKTSWPPQLRLGLMGVVLLVTVNILWMPRLGALLQEPVKEAALIAKTLPNELLVVNDHYTPSFHFYSGRFAQERESRPGDLVFTKKHRLKSFQTMDVLYEKYGLVLARIPQNVSSETNHEEKSTLDGRE